MTVKDSAVVLQKRQVLPSSGREVVIVSINRPDRLNCFNSDVCDALASIFASLQHDTDLAAVILTGEGSSFCAGADLSDPPNPLVQSSDLPEHLKVNPVHQMSALQVPLIGALRGYVSCLPGLIFKVSNTHVPAARTLLIVANFPPLRFFRSLRVELSWHWHAIFWWVTRRSSFVIRIASLTWHPAGVYLKSCSVASVQVGQNWCHWELSL